MKPGRGRSDNSFGPKLRQARGGFLLGQPTLEVRLEVVDELLDRLSMGICERASISPPACAAVLRGRQAMNIHTLSPHRITIYDGSERIAMSSIALIDRCLTQRRLNCREVSARRKCPDARRRGSLQRGVASAACLAAAARSSVRAFRPRSRRHSHHASETFAHRVKVRLSAAFTGEVKAALH